uniref:Uncharacterized protein n=1 Tax=Alexandrium catenella TaxID=2925 RepID=A0A7S1R7Q7_ALECA
MLSVVEAHFGSELKFVSAADGAALYRLKFEEIYASLWRPLPRGGAPPPDFPPPPEEMRLGTLAGAAILEVELCDREAVRRRVRALHGRLNNIERLKCRGLEALDQQQREKANQEGELRSSLAKLERQLEMLEQPEALVFEITSAWGSHLLEIRAGGSCREVARRFIRDHNMDMPLAQPLAERMQQRLRASTLNNSPGDAPLPAAPKRHGPKPKVIDLGDKDAVRRRVRALQKKLREIEKLKTCSALIVDQLQQEKLDSEAEVRHQCAVLERELDLLERLPKMVFDVETDTGVRYIEFREGDDCLDLALRFCQDHGLDEELVEPLADHMDQRLRDQAVLQCQEAEE